jgi:hypothetical protein
MALKTLLAAMLFVLAATEMPTPELQTELPDVGQVSSPNA